MRLSRSKNTRRVCALVDPAPAEHGERHEDETDQRGLEHAPGPDLHHVDAHRQRDRDRGAHGRGGPRAAEHRVHHHQAEHADQDDHDREHAHQRGGAAERADLLAHHLAERLAAAPQRADQDGEVLHRAAQHHADQDVERAGQVAELGGQDRAHQRARPGDRREVVAEHHPAVGRDEVLAVAPLVRGRRRARHRAGTRGRARKPE